MQCFLNAWRRTLSCGLGAGLAALTMWPACAPAQNFAQPQVVPTGSWPVGVYTADVNADGIPDLVYTDTANGTAYTTHVLIGNGKGGFTANGQISTSASVALGDFIGNGAVEIAWVQPGGSTGLCPQMVQVNIQALDATGKPNHLYTSTFCAVVQSAPVFANLTTGKIYAGKGTNLLFDDTANGALFVVNLNGNGSSLGTTEAFSVAPSIGIGTIAVADLNGDGNPDIVSLNPVNGNYAVYLSSGNGSFLSSYTSSGQHIHSILLKDVNGDGRPDLIAEDANGHIDVYAGNGDGTFQSASSGGTGTLNGLTGNGGHLIGIADLNHDGLPDGLTSTPAGVSVLLGNGTQYLGLGGIYNAGPGGSSYALADFNSDGNLDLALDSPEGIAILYGQVDGSFQTSRSFAAGQPAMSGTTGVFTASGNVDAVVSTGPTQAQFLKGNGDGTFTYAGSPGSPTPTTSQPGPAGLWGVVKAGDFNLDGKQDIVLTADGPAALLPTSGAGVTIQSGDGAGGFAAPSTPVVSASTACSSPPAPLYGVSAVGNDGGVPFLANLDRSGPRTFGGSTAPLSVTENDGNDICSNYNPHHVVATGDLNGDGADDMLAEYLDYAGDLLLFQGLTGAASSGQFIGRSNLARTGVTVSAGQALPPNVGGSPFLGVTVPVSSGGLGFPAAIGSVAIADLDRDGNPDILVTYANLAANLAAPSASAPNYLYIWFGSGNFTYFTSAKHPVNPVVVQLSRNYYQVAVADMNDDGIPDLILSDGYIISVQLGKGDGTFGAETHYLAGQGINTISIADVNHDGLPDLIVANGGQVLTNPVANLDKLGTNPDVNTGGITVLVTHATTAPPPSGQVSASPNPSVYGSGFVITAKVSPAVAGGPVPSGSVSFLIDSIILGTGTLSATGTATFNYPAPSTLVGGVHVLTVFYFGDSNYPPINFSANQTVMQNSLTASPEPSVYFSPYTITATVPGPGTVTFSEDGTSLGSVTTTTNTASIAGLTSALPGTHSLAATWTATVSALALQLSGSHTVNEAPVNVVLTPTTPLTVYYGQAVDGIISYTVVDPTHPATGGYTVLSNGTPVPYCTSLPNASNCPYGNPNFLDAGSYTLVIDYLGDTVNAPSSSAGVTYTVLPDTTATTLTSSRDPAPAGTAVTLTATVAGNVKQPTGSVTFTDGMTILGTVPLVNGVATLTTSTLPVGLNNIVAGYAATQDFAASVSAVLKQQIQQNLTTSVTLTASPEPTTYGSAFTLTAQFAPPASGNPAPSGTVSFTVDGVAAGSAPLTGQASTVTVPQSIYATLQPGAHSIASSYPGDVNYLNVSTSATHTVTRIPTTMTLLLCVDPPGSNFPCGNPITSTPLISPVTMFYGQSIDGVGEESETDLTGTITFYNGPAVFCTLNANLQQGGSTCPPQSGYFPAGSQTVTVVYSGDATHAPSTSNGVVATVFPDITTTTLASSLNPASFGQNVIFTANVEGNFATATGTVTFYDGTSTLGTVTLDANGNATFPTSSLAIGTHAIRAQFNGSPNFSTSAPASLNQVILPVGGMLASVVTVTSNINPSAPLQSVLFTATVTVPGPFAIVPTGNITFMDGTATLGTAAINPTTGIATFTTSSLATGSHPITGVYAGAASTVGQLPAPNPPAAPGAHLLGATHAGMRLSGPAPHPLVAMRPNPALATPQATAATPQATTGTPTILGSTSAVYTQVVTSALTPEATGFVITVTPVPVTVGVGQTAVLLVSVRDASGFNQPVALSCAGLPNEATCSFVTSTIAAGGGSTTLLLQTSAPHACGSNEAYFAQNGSASPLTAAAFALPGILLAGFAFGTRRRRLGSLLMLALGLGALATISGCGNCTDLGTKPGSYTFNVVGTAGSTTASQTISMQVTLQ